MKKLLLTLGTVAAVAAPVASVVACGTKADEVKTESVSFNAATQKVLTLGVEMSAEESDFVSAPTTFFDDKATPKTTSDAKFTEAFKAKLEAAGIANIAAVEKTVAAIASDADASAQSELSKNPNAIYKFSTAINVVVNAKEAKALGIAENGSVLTDASKLEGYENAMDAILVAQFKDKAIENNFGFGVTGAKRLAVAKDDSFDVTKLERLTNFFKDADTTVIKFIV